ncbi:TPA: hypothetical protein JAV82_004339 [Kluyvera ascorbata]|nr:hypothetical protein [Kluyvera ascorbata]
MTPSEIQILSATIGLIGSLLSAFCTYGYEPSPLAEFCGGEEGPALEKRNRVRKFGQVTGLVLIAASFLMQIMAAL